MQLKKRLFGNKNEDKAISFLMKQGFNIVERNFYAKKLGEIDIIAFKDGILHFIEVKSSRGSFEPIFNITPKKMDHLIKSANYYLKVKKLTLPWCIDALIIKGNSIELIENITI